MSSSASSNHHARTHHHGSASSSAAASSAQQVAAGASSSAQSAPPPLSSAENAKKSMNFDVWMHDSLIRLYTRTQSAARVAEFTCGNGVALSRLMVNLRAPAESAARSGENAFGIEYYLGVDTDTTSAKNRWITKDMPFAAEFHDCDLLHQQLLTATAAPSPQIAPGAFDVIYCFKGLTRLCGTRESLQSLLRNVAALLKRDGLFVGTMIDPSIVWYKASKRERESGGKPASKHDKGEGVVYHGQGYRLDFPHMPRASTTPFAPFTPALKFYFQLTEPDGRPSKQQPQVSSYMIHAPTLVAEARALGLELIQMQNCLDFHQENGTVDVFAETFSKLSIFTRHSPTQLTQPQADLFSLHTTFAFRKRAEPPLQSPAADASAAPMQL